LNPPSRPSGGTVTPERRHASLHSRTRRSQDPGGSVRGPVHSVPTCARGRWLRWSVSTRGAGRGNPRPSVDPSFLWGSQWRRFWGAWADS